MRDYFPDYVSVDPHGLDNQTIQTIPLIYLYLFQMIVRLHCQQYTTSGTFLGPESDR